MIISSAVESAFAKFSLKETWEILLVEFLSCRSVSSFIAAGLTIVDFNEPRTTDEQAKISVAMAWLQKIPLYLYWELKK